MNSPCRVAQLIYVERPCFALEVVGSTLAESYKKLEAGHVENSARTQHWSVRCHYTAGI